jgi:hypothetical protein
MPYTAITSRVCFAQLPGYKAIRCGCEAGRCPVPTLCGHSPHPISFEQSNSLPTYTDWMMTDRQRAAQSDFTSSNSTMLVWPVMGTMTPGDFTIILLPLTRMRYTRSVSKIA